MGPSLTSMSDNRTNHTSRPSNLATMAPWSHWPHLLPLLGVGRAWVWPSEAPKDIPFERSSLFREAVWGWHLCPGWMVWDDDDFFGNLKNLEVDDIVWYYIYIYIWYLLIIHDMVICALACGIYTDLYIQYVCWCFCSEFWSCQSWVKDTPPAQIG